MWFPGAATTLKALSLGIMLFSLIRARNSNVRLTTDPGCTTPNTISLFGAFVVGDFKLPHHWRLAQQLIPKDDQWDAFLASLAWGALHKSFPVPALDLKNFESNVPLLPPLDGPPDCDCRCPGALAETSSSSPTLSLK